MKTKGSSGKELMICIESKLIRQSLLKLYREATQALQGSLKAREYTGNFRWNSI